MSLFMVDMKLNMIKPDHITSIETSLASNWIDDDGIMCSISKNNKNSVQEFHEHFDTLERALNNAKAPFLVDTSATTEINVGDRKILHERLMKVMSCGAFISKIAIINLGVNVYFRMRKSPIPIKMFKDEDEARIWLLKTDQELQDSKSS